ncbi:MAG: hypothetical protein ACOYKN_18735 [Pirellula sp.]
MTIIQAELPRDEPNHAPAFHWKRPGPASGLLDMVMVSRPFVNWMPEFVA